MAIPIDYDSYYWLAKFLGHTPAATYNFLMDAVVTPIMRFILQGNSIETAMSFVWLIMLVLIYLNLEFILSGAKAFFGRSKFVWLLVLCSAPLFIFEMLKFENDQFAYPLLSLSFLLYMKYLKSKKEVFFVSAIAISLISSMLWMTSLILAGLLLLNRFFKPGMFILIGLLMILFVPYTLVNEQIPMMAIFFLLFLNLGLIPYLQGQEKFQEIRFLGFAVFILAAWRSMFAIFSVPFLFLGAVWLYEHHPKFRLFFIAAGIASLICAFAFINVQSPTQEELNASNYTVSAAKDYNKQIMNDSDLGYLVQFYGGKPEYTFGTPTYSDGLGTYGVKVDWNNSIALTYENLDCTVLQEFGKVRVYDCP